MDKPAVTVRIDRHGMLGAVEIEGHSTPTELEETEPDKPMPGFRDDEFRNRPNPYLAG
jgi:hypothetical protein